MKGNEYQGCGEEYNVKKGKGEAITSPYKSRLLRRISSGKNGRGTEDLGKKSRIDFFFKVRGGEEYQVTRNFIHPDLLIVG